MLDKPGLVYESTLDLHPLIKYTFQMKIRKGIEILQQEKDVEPEDLLQDKLNKMMNVVIDEAEEVE